jgi:hypothetical protein
MYASLTRNGQLTCRLFLLARRRVYVGAPRTFVVFLAPYAACRPAQSLNALISQLEAARTFAREVDVGLLDCVGQPIAQFRAIAAADPDPVIVPRVQPMAEGLLVLGTLLRPEGPTLHRAVFGMQVVVDPVDMAKCLPGLDPKSDAPGHAAAPHLLRWILRSSTYFDLPSPTHVRSVVQRLVELLVTLVDEGLHVTFNPDLTPGQSFADLGERL